MAVKFNDVEYNRPPTHFPGTYRIEKLELISANGGTVDVGEQMVQLDLYESIDQAFLSGELVIMDTTNIIRSLPLTGEEVLRVSLNDETEGGKIDQDFRVYKISDRQQVRFGVLKYKLSFQSITGYRDNFVRVSKAYNVKRYEEAVADILLGTTFLNADKEFLTDTTEKPMCFVIPNWTAGHAINWCASRSRSINSQYGGGNFWFWEGIDRFNMLSLDNLFDHSKNKVYGTISYDPVRNTKDYKLTYDSRMPDDMMRFESFKVHKSVDMADNIRAGMLANRMNLVDLNVKTSTTIDYDYITDFDKGVHLTGGIGNQSYPIVRDSFEPTKEAEALWYVVNQQKGLFSQDKDGGYDFDRWVHKKVSQRQQMENFVITGMLPGHVGLKAGHQVFFDYPNVENLSVNESPNPDLYYQGNYLVTAVRRTFQKDKFWMAIEMRKDSLSLSLGGTSV